MTSSEPFGLIRQEGVGPVAVAVAVAAAAALAPVPAPAPPPHVHPAAAAALWVVLLSITSASASSSSSSASTSTLRLRPPPLQDLEAVKAFGQNYIRLHQKVRERPMWFAPKEMTCRKIRQVRSSLCSQDLH